MKTYFNIKGHYGVETVDELSRKDFKTYTEYKAESKRLVSEYHMVGMGVYRSQRCTNDWRATQ